MSKKSILYFLNISCGVRNPVDGKLALVFRLVKRSYLCNLFKSVIATACISHLWPKGEEQALLRSLRTSIADAKDVGRFASLNVKKLHAPNRAKQDSARSHLSKFTYHQESTDPAKTSYDIVNASGIPGQDDDNDDHAVCC